jgi:hypothetical protein
LGVPAFCEVRATISPVDGSRIGAVYRLPASWNGKVLGIGGGGAAGNLTIDAAADGLSRGYAVIQNDLGHASPNARDWSFAIRAPGQPNTEAIVDFGHRATHLATVAGKQVVEKFYGRSPQRAYWQGCSTGGRQSHKSSAIRMTTTASLQARRSPVGARARSCVCRSFGRPEQSASRADAARWQGRSRACDATTAWLTASSTTPHVDRISRVVGAGVRSVIGRCAGGTVDGRRRQDEGWVVAAMPDYNASDWWLPMQRHAGMPRGAAPRSARRSSHVVNDPSYDIATFDQNAI